MLTDPNAVVPSPPAGVRAARGCTLSVVLFKPRPDFFPFAAAASLDVTAPLQKPGTLILPSRQVFYCWGDQVRSLAPNRMRQWPHAARRSHALEWGLATSVLNLSLPCNFGVPSSWCMSHIKKNKNQKTSLSLALFESCLRHRTATVVGC